ncbi:DUF722 domain-containing protein [Clostridium perfringens]|uniref:DUF722 domain-containing protein n=1 Tax=Clostridium perfringens TaxID=1502 RepID=UPI0037DB93A9|nr:DUF722 domain-containing protein [Clostridium perfringens]
MNKEQIRKTEAILYDYNVLALTIEILKEEVDCIENEYNGYISIGYEERTQSTNKFNSVVENELLSKEKILVKKREELSKKIALKRRVDSAIKLLSDEEKTIVNKRYLDKLKLSWEEISKTLNYSKEHCRKNIKERALIKISRIIFI